MDHRKGLRNAAYICMRLAILGGILWFINAVVFFVEWFKNGFHLDFSNILTNYGGALIATIVSVLLLYCVGGVVNLLLDIEANTRKTP